MALSSKGVCIATIGLQRDEQNGHIHKNVACTALWARHREKSAIKGRPDLLRAFFITSLLAGGHKGAQWQSLKVA